MKTWGAVVVLLLVGCGDDTGAGGSGGTAGTGGSGGHAGSGGIDAPRPDAAIDAPAIDAEIDATPCTPGGSCVPANRCHTGIITCGDGEACADTGTPAVTCNALDQCHDIGTCNPSTGVCSNPPKADGTACNDNSACTLNDACSAGSCTGTAVVCAPLDQCHLAGTCNATTGVCSNPPKQDGSSCDDGDACTQTDTCQNGSCTGANPRVCAPLDSCHLAGTCDPNTGNCSNPNANDGTACNDGNPCTTNDVCNAGSCGGTAVTCTAQGQCFQAGTCDSSSGNCTNPFQPAGFACNENGGTACNGAGGCMAAPQVVATNPADASSTPANLAMSVIFSNQMDPTSLTAQTTAGTCSGSIQASLDGFASCIAFSSASPVMTAGDTVANLVPAPGFLVNRTYKVRVTTAARNIATLPLASQYTSASGFITFSPNTCDGSLVISQIYGGGGNSGATFRNDFIELHNRGTTVVNLGGYSVQYAPAAGTTWSVTTLPAVALQPGQYFLVQEAAGAGGTTSLPAPDATGSINLSASAGKVALSSSTTALTGACPANVVDLVGYGSTTCFEGPGPATAPSGNVNSVTRIVNGCSDVNDNAIDFTNGTGANPRNTVVSAQVCGCGALNEGGTTAEADYCDVQFPLGLSVTAGMTTPSLFGRYFETGVTPSGGTNTSVRAQVGYGPLAANPEYDSSWTWINATFNATCSGCGNNDEYQATFTAPAAGTYGYVYRFSIDQGMTWTYCDQDAGDFGAGSNPGLTFSFADIPVMTVTP